MCTPRRKFDVHAESDAEGTLSGRCGGLVFGRSYVDVYEVYA